MAALIPEHKPGVRREVSALVMPYVLVQGVAVAEHNGDRRALQPAHLDVQRHAVVGENRDRAAAKLTERLVPGRVGPQPAPADRDPPGGDNRPGPGCRHTAGKPRGPSE